jgi:hypothetical protein
VGRWDQRVTLTLLLARGAPAAQQPAAGSGSRAVGRAWLPAARLRDRPGEARNVVLSGEAGPVGSVRISAEVRLRDGPAAGGKAAWLASETAGPPVTAAGEA